MKLITSLLLLCLSLPLLAYDTGRKQLGHLETYKPNTIGYTKADNDVGFVDFQLSFMYPLFHDNQPASAAAGFLPYPYFTFTGRFGQYIRTRPSSPVIAKSYNPELFFRYWLSPEGKDKDHADKLDFIYGHESNGQSINTESSYKQKQIDLIADGDDPAYADDYISRGWDYVSMRWGHNWNQHNTADSHFTTYLSVKTFLDSGLLQKNQEDYNDWENNPEGKPRAETDGIELSARFNTSFNSGIVSGDSIIVTYTTGLENSFQFNTYKAEFVLDIGNLPLMIWARHGYNSDLVDYYQEVTSVGLGIEFLGL